eukprot:TRINITY_DN3797_c0_g1_i2.p1 TRINITY_DN3797_c0_g1~~TRINITY_DN3797_c0_g1_i2.p1  ORF type:complete len:260 (+),score=67.71 TRINITY_DN3797_c0_g1_i2:269-1048(+)
MMAQSTLAPGTPEADIEDLVIFTRAAIGCLAVRTGAEAMMLLRRSDRVKADIGMAELMAQKNFRMSLVLREWNASIKPEWEFRVFVIQGRLTAATQYSNIVYVPEIAQQKDEIKECIMSFWEKVQGNIRTPHYTIDLALSPDLKEVVIVEINGPPPSAGTSLYDWNKDEDRRQIMAGETFELRVMTHPRKGAKDEIHQPLRRYIERMRAGLDSGQDEDEDEDEDEEAVVEPALKLEQNTSDLPNTAQRDQKTDRGCSVQ